MRVVELVIIWAPLRVSVAHTSELFSRGARKLVYLPTNSQEEAVSAIKRRNVRTPDLCVCLTYKHWFWWPVILASQSWQFGSSEPIYSPPRIRGLFVRLSSGPVVKNPHLHYRGYNKIQFSHPAMSNSLRPHGLQHTRLPCPSPTPGAYSNSCPSRRWCCPIISSSDIPFSSCFQSFSASGSFPRSQFFVSGDQIIGVLASVSVLQMNIQDCFPLGLTGLFPGLAVYGTHTCLLQHHSSKASILWHSAFFKVQLSHPYMTTGKTIPWLDGPLLAK